jgi:hypothetical protein
MKLGPVLLMQLAYANVEVIGAFGLLAIKLKDLALRIADHEARSAPSSANIPKVVNSELVI